MTYQLMVTNDDRLAVLTAPVPGPNGPRRIYLINPDTGAVELDAAFPVIPEPTCAAAVQMVALWMLTRRRHRFRGT